MEIRLEPKTRAGRNKLATVQFADPHWDGRWVITLTQDSVNFAPGKRGPWHLIEPLCDDEVRGYNARWVHATNDDNFTMQPNTAISRPAPGADG